jgi:catechol 2,3-dioxygenase-like lactoylglutathione lyase family enzyme
MSTEQILEDYRAGTIERRSAIRRLAVCFAAAFAGGPALAGETDPTFRSIGLNHLALRVTNVARSRDFYIENFGFEVLRDNLPHNCFLACGDNFLALFRNKTAGMDHFCVTIDGYDPADVLQRLESAGIESHRVENRVYFEDPDGLKGQVSGRFSSWPGRRP